MWFPNQADEGALEAAPLDAPPAHRRDRRQPRSGRRWRVALAVCAVALAVVAPLVALTPTRALLIGLLPTPTPAPPTPVPLHVTRPQATILTSIDMISPSEGWAVGYDSGIDMDRQQHPYLLHFLHGAWTVEPLPQLSVRLYTIAMVSPHEGWIGGEGLTADGVSYGEMLHATDGHWSNYPLPAGVGAIQAIDMISPSEGWAVSSTSETGALHGQILHYAQGQWRVELTTPDVAQFQSISMVSATEGWAAGSGSGSSTSVLWHYANATWQHVTLNDPKQADLEYVSMLSPDAGWGIGNFPLPHQGNDQYQRSGGALWRYAGGQWRVVARYTDDSGQCTHLTALQAISPDDVWISEGDCTTSNLMHFINGAWQKTLTPTGALINSFSMFNAREGWAVGSVAQIAHEVNGTWRAYPTP